MSTYKEISVAKIRLIKKKDKIKNMDINKQKDNEISSTKDEPTKT